MSLRGTYSLAPPARACVFLVPTLAPYASAVSNLLIVRDCFGGTLLAPPRNDITCPLTAYTAFSRGAAIRPTQREERVWKSNFWSLNYTGSRLGFVPHKTHEALSTALHSKALEQRCAIILGGWSGRFSAGYTTSFSISTS